MCTAKSVCMCLNLYAPFIFHLCGWNRSFSFEFTDFFYGSLHHVPNLFFQYTYLNMNSKIIRRFNLYMHLRTTEQRPHLYFQMSDLKDLNLQWNQHGTSYTCTSHIWEPNTVQILRLLPNNQFPGTLSWLSRCEDSVIQHSSSYYCKLYNHSCFQPQAVSSQQLKDDEVHVAS